VDECEALPVGRGGGSTSSPRTQTPAPGLVPGRELAGFGEMPIQSCGQGVSAPHGKAGASLNAHTELRAKRQRSAREAIYRKRPILMYQTGCIQIEKRGLAKVLKK